MKYMVRVFEVQLPREVNGAMTTQKPAPLKEFDVLARTLDGCRQVVKRKIEKQESIFKDKELRSLSFSPEPAPYGSVLVYIQPARKRNTMTRSGKDLGR